MPCRRVESLLSFQRVLFHSQSPWNLSFTEKDTRPVVSVRDAVTASFSYLKSFFSNAHRNTFTRHAISLATELEASSPHDESEKIALEKAAKLGFRKLKKKEKTSLTKEYAIDDDLSQPVFNGRYKNHPREGIFWQALDSFRCLFVPQLAFRNTHLSSTDKLVSPWDPLSRSNDCQITWIGHETLLIQVSSFNIITDPIFGDATLFYRRHTRPGIAFDKLPLIDVVALSHNHHDHADNETLQRLAKYQPLVVAPHRMGGYLQSFGFHKISENGWWDKTVYTKTIENKAHTLEIYSVPATHNSQRCGDFNRSLWQGIVFISGETKLYFAGDTALDPEIFEQITEKFGEFDVAFLPIAPEGEEAVHLNCRQSLEVFLKHIKAKVLFPVHWGTFRQDRDLLEAPLERLKNFLTTETFSRIASKVLLPSIGQRYSKKELVSKVK